MAEFDNLFALIREEEEEEKDLETPSKTLARETLEEAETDVDRILSQIRDDVDTTPSPMEEPIVSPTPDAEGEEDAVDSLTSYIRPEALYHPTDNETALYLQHYNNLVKGEPLCPYRLGIVCLRLRSLGLQPNRGGSSLQSRAEEEAGCWSVNHRQKGVH